MLDDKSWSSHVIICGNFTFTVITNGSSEEAYIEDGTRERLLVLLSNRIRKKGSMSG